jgi:hypothetical protein
MRHIINKLIMEKPHYTTITALALLASFSCLIGTTACSKNTDTDSAIEQLEQDTTSTGQQVESIKDNAIDSMKSAQK